MNADSSVSICLEALFPLTVKKFFWPLQAIRGAIQVGQSEISLRAMPAAAYADWLGCVRCSAPVALRVTTR
jgi:hypothetical protein